MDKPTRFASVTEATTVAMYLEQMLLAEYQWISNRLSWLFISQSFCISAYTILSTSAASRFVDRNTIAVLQKGLPIFGMICCVVVFLAVSAAKRVAKSLKQERARLVHYINENSPTMIPLTGEEGDLKDERWTYVLGELPHWVLPWVLGILWFYLIAA
jgi:SNF family Na+-dependent transporter